MQSLKERSSKAINGLNWNLSAQEILQNTDKLTENFENELDEVITRSPKNFETIVKAIEELESRTTDNYADIYFPAYVSDSKEIRDAATDARQKLDKFFIKMGMRVDVYEAVKEAAKANDELTSIESRLLDRTLRDGKRNGLDLDKAKQDEVTEIKNNISERSIAFDKAIFDLKDTVQFTKNQLEGIPESVMSGWKPDDDGFYNLGMSYPEVLPILDFAKNPDTRHRMMYTYSNRAADVNPPRLEETISLRDRAAKILGYNNHAEFILEIRLAKNPENVLEFLNDLQAKLKVLAESELKELEALKKELEPEEDGTVFDQDWAYFKRISEERKHNLDQDLVKQYFPTLYVVHEMLEFYQEVFGLKFEETNKVDKWHSDVQVFEVSDTKTQEYIGRFFLDLYPRDGKYNHAAAFTLIKPRLLPSGEFQASASVMVCNFNKPTESTPALLTHREVQTLFHEFGHIIHQVISKAIYGRFAGTAVSRDFVEACSQILENWLYEEEVLNRITKHYKTGEKLPRAIIDSLIETRKSYSGITNLRQVFFSKFDMKGHMSPEFKLKENWQNMRKEIALIPAVPDTNGAAAFSHMNSGYDSSYYGYLWSKVYAQDMYTVFQDKGVTSPEAGMAYRKLILERGGEVDEEDMVREYLGREMNNEAFLKTLGLAEIE